MRGELGNDIQRIKESTFRLIQLKARPLFIDNQEFKHHSFKNEDVADKWLVIKNKSVYLLVESAPVFYCARILS